MRRRRELGRHDGGGPACARRAGGPGSGSPLGAGEAGIGRVDCVGQAGVEPQPAVAFSELLPACECAQNGDRAWPALLDRLQWIGARGRRACRVEGVEAGRRADDRERVTPEPGRHRLGHTEHRGGGECRICRVAAALERAQPGARRQRLARRDHGLVGGRRRPPVREPKARHYWTRAMGTGSQVPCSTCRRRHSSATSRCVANQTSGNDRMYSISSSSIAIRGCRPMQNG
jgi:hypothetical protein